MSLWCADQQDEHLLAQCLSTASACSSLRLDLLCVAFGHMVAEVYCCPAVLLCWCLCAQLLSRTMLSGGAALHARMLNGGLLAFTAGIGCVPLKPPVCMVNVSSHDTLTPQISFVRHGTVSILIPSKR